MVVESRAVAVAARMGAAETAAAERGAAAPAEVVASMAA